MSETMLDAVIALHKLRTKTQCGAISIPLVHHHSIENDRNPGPLRVLRCSEDADHEGPHKDCICCYKFQTFEDWQVADRKPIAFDGCAACRTLWPCDTITALQEATR